MMYDINDVYYDYYAFTHMYKFDLTVHFNKIDRWTMK